MKSFSQKLNFANTLYSAYVIILATLFSSSLLIEKGQCVLFINGLHSPFLDWFMPVVTNLGDGLIFIPIIIALLFIRFQYCIMALIIMASSGILSSIFKRILFPGAERPRKFLDNSLLHFVPGVDVHGSNSFPSGHTVTAFCAALFITLLVENRIIGMLCLIAAMFVAFSRIYLLQHFLIDVAAGAVIGCFTTYTVWQIFENNRKPGWMKRRVTIDINLKSKTRRGLNRA